MALQASWAAGKYTLTFATGGATDGVSGVDPRGFVVMHTAAGGTLKSKCTTGAALAVSYSGDSKGYVSVAAASERDLKKNKFRICAKVRGCDWVCLCACHAHV